MDGVHFQRKEKRREENARPTEGSELCEVRVITELFCREVGFLALCSASSTLSTDGSRRRASKNLMHRGLHPLQGEGRRLSLVEIVGREHQANTTKLIILVTLNLTHFKSPTLHYPILCPPVSIPRHMATSRPMNALPTRKMLVDILVGVIPKGSYDNYKSFR